MPIRLRSSQPALRFKGENFCCKKSYSASSMEKFFVDPHRRLSIFGGSVKWDSLLSCPQLFFYHNIKIRNESKVPLEANLVNWFVAFIRRKHDPTCEG